ncbi:MAG: PKD domain-containing protein, partial [Winogradskyella sp.]
MQNGTFNQCTDMFYDSGGPSGIYSSNENFTLTICPDTPGDSVSLNFTSFNTETGADILTIFDGDDTSASQLGQFSGSSSPGLIEATSANTSGCLTITFSSNGNGNTLGWVAEISCFTPCQTITANVDSTTPAVGSGNAISADVNDTISFNGSGTFSNDGTGATYLWDFGDGNTAMGQSVTHAYTVAGIYNVTLTITDTSGCTSTNNINLSAQIGVTSPGNPSVNAGDDVDIPCDETCTTLNASFLDIGDTSTYTVNSIPYVPPFPFDGLANTINNNIDDAWAGVESLPFDFCFFDQIETQFQVGSNGLIRFDVDPSDATNAWNLQNNTLPNNTNPALGEGNVFTPVHDINPAASTGEEIAWEFIGVAPNRVLVVSFFNVEMWNCPTAIATHMAVFYETTNVIDIYIQDAPFCDEFNNNKAVGIQNDAGTQAFVPPGRNTNEGGTLTMPGWTTSDEAWRFTPAGPSIVEFAWLDAMGNVISNDASFEVCPTDPSTTYTAQVTYTNCNGDVTVVTDDVTVTTNIPFIVDLGPDQELCIGDPDVLLDATVAGSVTYQWALDGVDLPGETNPTLTVSSPDSGVYSVTVTEDVTNCISVDDVAITFFETPVLSSTLDTSACSDDAIGIILDLDIGDLASTTFNITGINTNGLVASAGAPVVGNGFGANEIADDAYTNTTILPVPVIYTIVPVSGAANCLGNAVDVTVMVNPVPVLSIGLDTTVCSDVASGIILDIEAGSIAASTYNITAINTNGLVASAGAPAVGNGFGANEISDDAYTNTTNLPVPVIYTIVPVSADNCEGLALDVNLMVNPEPVLSANLDTTVCSDDLIGVVLDVAPGSVAAATYNIIAINDNGLVASAGAPAVGNGFGVNEIADDAYTNTTNLAVPVTYTIVPVSADNCEGDAFDVNVTISPEPILSASLDVTVCSDNVSGIVLDVGPGSIAAATYNIIAINDNGLVASAGAPAVGNGFGANEIADDAYTNMTNAPVVVTYTIVPVNADNCSGNALDVNLTINPEPVLSTTLDGITCSDTASGIVLDVEPGSIAAVTYNIIAINDNGLVASAGAPAVGNGFGANEISDDAYTNTTNLPVPVIYTIVPVSADNCEGDAFDVNVTINPEPVLSTTLDTTVCTDTASGIVLDVAPGSIAAATYNIIAINDNGLVASAGAPVVGNGFGVNEIADDAYTNTTNLPVPVTYTIVPVSADNCEGDAFDVNLTISPEPILSTTLDATVCSDDVSGIVLDVEPGSIAAVTYNIIAINDNGLVASAGAPVVGNGFGANEIADDAYTNMTNAPVVVTYTIVPVSADNCDGNPFDVNVTINPEPVLSTTLDGITCSDTASGIVLDVAPGSIAAATYNIIAINDNGLVASAGAPAVGNGFGANEIADDAYTNTTNLPVPVTYTIVPVSADNCEGDAFDVNVTINPEPVLSTTLDTTVCTDTASGIVLDVAPGSIAAATYNIIAINDNGLVASAGAPVVGNGFGANEIADDAYTNTTNLPVPVTYTIVPVSADNCEGDAFDVNVTISPEPILSTTLDATVCSDDVSGIVLDVEPGSIAAATYNIIAINDNGLVASAGAPVVGNGFGANEIADDAYTNMTNAPVVVTYTIVPVSADNCDGNPFDV